MENDGNSGDYTPGVKTKSIAGGSGRAGAVGLGFGVPGSAEKNDDGRELHPDEQADDGRESSVEDAVGHTANVGTEEDVGSPPEEGGDDGAGDDVAKAAFLRAGDAVDESEGG